MASARVMRGAGGLTAEKPTIANKIHVFGPCRDVRALAERRDYSNNVSNNVVVGPQTNVRELSAVGAGLSR
jgi:hypothetical protein